MADESLDPFRRVHPHGSPNPTTTIGDSGSFFRTRYPIFRRLRFEGNTFVDFPRRAMFVSSCRDVVIRGNTFENPSPRRQHNPERGSIRVELSTGLDIRGNLWKESPYHSPNTVEWDEGTVEGVSTDQEVGDG